MRVWRISEHADLSGTGGLIASGRWHRKGRRIVYAADHPATAMLEVLAQLADQDLPASLQLIALDVPDDLPVLVVKALPPDWRTRPDRTATLGMRLLGRRTSPIVKVPSALLPHAHNVIIDPEHPHSGGVAIASVERFALDVRFARVG